MVYFSIDVVETDYIGFLLLQPHDPAVPLPKDLLANCVHSVPADAVAGAAGQVVVLEEFGAEAGDVDC